ncbi:MAG TPA: class I mannose-6-phosphate isomerase [Candidatus Dormibacteraeota bacterium]|nr:class I mannose-6-phosphate isomerase [Candidatus Dormibacteraeota bacterium]
MRGDALPARIEPRQVPRIWGRRRLDPVYPATDELPEPVGEVWLTGRDCRFLEGRFAGKTLGEAWRTMPIGWRGTRLAGEREFPILAKFLFPELSLSVQVHPDGSYAARHEAAAGGRGKTEMWYVVAAEPQAAVMVGLEEGMDKASFRQAIEAGTAEQTLNKLPVSEGETIYLPSGTVHAIGPGQVLCEIQEYSDLTYRVFDYNRVDAQGNPRELHVEKALDVIQFGGSSGGKTRPVVRNRGPVEVTYLAACRHFAAERWRFVEPFDLPPAKEHFDLLIFIGGEGELVAGENRREFHHGEVWFVPADSDGCRLEPRVDTTLLRAYLPDLASLKRSLREDNVTPQEMAGFFFE